MIVKAYAVVCPDPAIRPAIYRLRAQAVAAGKNCRFYTGCSGGKHQVVKLTGEVYVQRHAVPVSAGKQR